MDKKFLRSSLGSKNREARIAGKPHVDMEKRTVEMSYSSEYPVERSDWGGDYYEVLGHKSEEINAERMDNAPFLHCHDMRSQLGAVLEHKTPDEDGRCRAKVQMSRSLEGTNALQDYQDGIRKNISVGYDVHSVQEVKKEDLTEEMQKHIKRNIPIIRVTRWTPSELSDAPVPADHTVGAGRRKPRRDAAETGEEITAEEIEEDPEKFVEQFEFEEDGKHVKKDADGKPVKKTKSKGGIAMTEIELKEREAKLKEDARKEALLNLKKRQSDIQALADMHKNNPKVQEIVREYTTGAKSEASLEDFKHDLLTKAFEARAIETSNSRIGLDNKQLRDYSILKAIRGLLAAQTGGGKFDGLEAEVSREVAKRLGKEPGGFFVPDECLGVPFPTRMKQRDLSTLTGPAGGFGVETEVMAQDFIWLLRNRMIAPTLGVTMLNGLEGNLAIPKQTGAATAYWVAENAAGTESDQTTGQVGLTPRQLIAFTDFSKQLLAQSSLDVEGFVRDDLALVMAIALDSALINGTGADGQPLGLLNMPGLSIVSLGSNGGAPTKAANVQLKTNVAGANADFGNLAYLTNANGRGKQESTVEVSGFPTWLWNDVPTGKVGELPMGRVQGTPAYVSNQVPSNLVKGGSGAVCSAQIYGNWQSAMIGRWANALDILVNPYSKDTQREIRISMSLMADINFRWLPAFSAIVDMTTT